MRTMKKHIGVILILTMLLTLAFAIPKTAKIGELAGAADTAYAATKKSLTTVRDIQYSGKENRIEAGNLGRFFYLNSKGKLCMSKGLNAKSTTIGYAREVEYIATDGRQVFFTDVTYNQDKDYYVSKIRVYDIGTKKLKTLKTLKNRHVSGIFAAHNKLFYYSGEGYFSISNLIKISRTGKTKTMIKNVYPLEEGLVKGSYRVIVEEVRTGANTGDIYYKATELNCKTEKKRTLLSGKDLRMTLKNSFGFSFIWSKEAGTDENVVLKQYSWKSGSLRTIGKFAAKDTDMSFLYSEGDNTLCGMSSKLSAKQRPGYEALEEPSLMDIAVFTVDRATGTKNILANYKEVSYPYLTTCLVNISKDSYDWNYKPFAAVQFLNNSDGSTSTYVFREGKAYYLGESDAERKKFEVEFDGLDPVIY